MRGETMLSNKDALSYDDKLKILKEEINTADAILIGAGAGLSTSAGFTYSGERFKKHFSAFEKRYGFHDMYSGGFYDYPTAEEFWAFWSIAVTVNRYEKAPLPVYENIFKSVCDKNYFVLTTNVDHCFQKAGFDKKRLFYTQGDYGLFQCSEPCTNETYDNQKIIKEMVERQTDLKIPTDLLPVCPHCGKPMAMNLRSDDSFVEDAGWYAAARRYEDFLDKNENKHILFLELGVGYNTPGIIKYPFWQMTYKNKNAFYVCINYGNAFAPDDIRKRAMCIDSDIGAVFDKIVENTGVDL
jgi:NAD-dependent SIR2 family protein deacetylase